MENAKNLREEKLKAINQEFNKMQELIISKGLTQIEINNILLTYKTFLDLRNDNDDEFIEHNNQLSFPYSSKKVKYVSFETKNEVRLLHCLNNVNPNFKSDELGRMVGMICHLLGVKTEWYEIPNSDLKQK